ncbi:MAG: glycosyltransferase [Candidatus Cloacimonetes bacterium]|nr:glycosyltransferase [Candidatus Cloacimonadota bacterium]
MKVCHMTSVHSSFDIIIFSKECISLSKHGFDTCLVSQGESRIDNGVNVIGVGSAPKGRLARILFFTKCIYKNALATNADIYHIHDPELLPYTKRLKMKGKRVIFDSHEDILNQVNDKEWIPAFLRKIIGRCLKIYYQKILKRIDVLISVTPHIVDELKEININTYQITNYPIVSSRMKEKTESSDNFVLCFTGGINKQWNHINILKAIENINDVKYAICGQTTDDCINLMSKYPSWNKVDYRGDISHHEAISLQLNSNCGMALLQPSENTKFNFGTIGNTKLFEYMLTGLPIICSDFILWKEIVDKYSCGLYVDPLNIKAITEAILYLKNNPTEARAMGEAGRNAVENEYNWESQEMNLLKIYKEVI